MPARLPHAASCVPAFAAATSTAATYRPVVLMHGLDADNESMSHMQGWIEADFPGIHVHNAEVGGAHLGDSVGLPLVDGTQTLVRSHGRVLAVPVVTCLSPTALLFAHSCTCPIIHRQPAPPMQTSV